MQWLSQSNSYSPPPPPSLPKWSIIRTADGALWISPRARHQSHQYIISFKFAFLLLASQFVFIATYIKSVTRPLSTPPPPPVIRRPPFVTRVFFHLPEIVFFSCLRSFRLTRRFNISALLSAGQVLPSPPISPGQQGRAGLKVAGEGWGWVAMTFLGGHMSHVGATPLAQEAEAAGAVPTQRSASCGGVGSQLAPLPRPLRLNDAFWRLLTFWHCCCRLLLYLYWRFFTHTMHAATAVVDIIVVVCSAGCSISILMVNLIIVFFFVFFFFVAPKATA